MDSRFRGNDIITFLNRLCSWYRLFDFLVGFGGVRVGSVGGIGIFKEYSAVGDDASLGFGIDDERIDVEFGDFRMIAEQLGESQ